MAEPIRLFQIGQRGVDVVNKPQDLDESELATGQNVEIVTSAGAGALDQRAGMTRMNAIALNSGASVLMAHDVPSAFQSDYTPTLYVPFVTAGTAKWRKSTDGTTWTSVNVPNTYIHNPPIANAPGYFKAAPKVVTVGRYLYFAGAVTTYGTDSIPIWSFDGTTAQIVGYIPPCVTGVALATPVGNLGIQNIGTAGAATWSYKYVARLGVAYSAASAADTTTTGNANLTGTNYNAMTNGSSIQPVAGATSYDVYRTAVGTSPATTGLIGNIPIVSGSFTFGNGSGGANPIIFSDQGLAGDASVAPAVASGTAVSSAIVVLDMITDGSNLYLAVLDVASTSGRLLSFNPATATWAQIGATFATADGNGVASTLVFHDGSLVFGTYFGTGAGNAIYVQSAKYPLPVGGVSAVHAFAVSYTVASMAVFNGGLYVGTCWLGGGITAAAIFQRLAQDTWASVRTGPALATKNAWTSLGVFNGRLYAGWTSGDGATAARIESTADGTSWSLEFTCGMRDVPAQMAIFNNALYVCCARTTEPYNNTSIIYKRTSTGTWSTADDPSDDFAGAIGVVYA